MTRSASLAFVVALLVSVMLHEAGHFLTAKRVRHEGDPVLRRLRPDAVVARRGETEYGVKAIPAGGFVKIVGMTDLEEVEPRRRGPRASTASRRWQRLRRAVAGSVVHFVIALVLLYLVLAITGDILKAEPTLRIGGVSTCVPPSLDRRPRAPPRRPQGARGGKLKPDDVDRRRQRARRCRRTTTRCDRVHARPAPGTGHADRRAATADLVHRRP